MSTPRPQFTNDDEAAQHWLRLLRDGDDAQKFEAREQLAGIFERRGMHDEAADLRSANARASIQPSAPVEPIRAPAPAVAAQPVRSHPWYLRTPAIIGVSSLCLPPLALVFVWMRPWRQAFKIAASVPLGIWSLFWLLLVVAAMIRPTPAPTAVSATPPPTAIAFGSTQQPATQGVAAKPEPTPRPATATPGPPTATPVPPPTVVFTGRFDPKLLRVGEKLVVELTLENKSDRQLEGIRFASSGPWDKYTIVNVIPNGRHESGFLGGHSFSTGMVIPPGQKRSLNIVAYPNEPGSHDFTFTAHHNNTQRLTPAEGSDIMIGGKVSVIR